MDYEKLHKDTINKLQQMVNSGKIKVEIARGICADFVPESEDEKIRRFIKDVLDSYGRSIKCPTKDILLYEKSVAWLEKQGEQKPTDEEMKELLQTEYEKGRADAIAEMKKPAAWSEEDERMYRGLHNLIYSTPYCDSRKELSDWLESLKNRVRPQIKQKWNKEDEKLTNRIEGWLDTLCLYLKDDNSPECIKDVKDILEKLESFRPQNRWKPSDEQMNNK